LWNDLGMAESKLLEADDQRTAGHGGTRSRGWPAAVIAVVVAIGAVSVWWFAHSAEAFDTSGTVTMSITAPASGTPLNFGVLSAPLPDLSIEHAQPVLEKGSGPVAVAVSVCRVGSIGTSVGPLGSECVSADGVDLAGMPDTAQLVVTVVPLSEQAVHVTGLRIRFADGWRTGEQTLPLNLRG
jgi:hypothetical protein